jgi:hypothetical protein
MILLRVDCRVTALLPQSSAIHALTMCVSRRSDDIADVNINNQCIAIFTS